MLPTTSAVFNAAGLTPDGIDAVAVTVEPGLATCLKVGAAFALNFSAKHRYGRIFEEKQ